MGSSIVLAGAGIAAPRNRLNYHRMHPTRFQRLFTDNRPIFFLMALGALALSARVCWILVPTLTPSPWSIGEFVIMLVVAACLGALIGAFPCGYILGPILKWIEHRNGAPFHEGDEVVILSKRFPGRVTRIYAVWAERHEVRVELGEVEREKVTDVFSYTDVCRAPTVD